MSGLPVLTLMMVVPVVGALVVGFAPLAANAARQLALGFSLVTLALGVLAWTRFDTGFSGGQFQLTETHQWIPQFGVSYAVGVDGIALALILMAVILVPICLLAAWRDVDEFVEGSGRVRTYFALMLVLEAFMVGVFAARDVFLFYVLFEAMLIPVYFLIGSFGGARRRAASLKFLLYSLAGGLIMLVAVIGVYAAGPGGADGFLVEKLTGNLTASEWGLRLMFLGFFIAFAIKAPMVPVHTWLPDAAEAARPATSVLLVGVLDKVGTYGMIRFCLQLFPEATRWATPVVVGLALVSVLHAGLVAIGQKDMMRLIAYTSVSHFGFIVLGIFALSSVGGAGSTLYMVNHGFSTAGLFLLAGCLIARRRSQQIADFGGWQRVTPILAGTFLVAGLSSLALPGLSSFLSEFLTLQATFQRWPLVGAFATFGIVLAALYILLMYQRLFTGPKATFEEEQTPADLGWRERAVVIPIIASFLFLGCYPKPLLDVINPAVAQTLHHAGASDPAGATLGSAK